MSDCNTTADSPEYTNRLADQSSPYLLQHAHNPVDWYPWGEEALDKARKEDKLLIVSIGYAACHWCHVMEHESFEDPDVARVMNDHFVSIKVDREERPDVDDVYMTACQLASQRGCGWPLNAFALPDGRPVWAGTYFPKDQWLNVLEQFIKIKEKEPENLEYYAKQLVQGMSDMDKVVRIDDRSQFEHGELAAITRLFVGSVDERRGGRRGAPKFPMPVNWEYLMRYASQTGDEKARAAVITTLDNMAAGGIYDQVGGGFARYSVDGRWHVPHFEKMLYDNGQLVSLYAHALQWTGNQNYGRIVRETIEFAERELSDPSGGFYSSLDADSEGEEGKFYVWTHSEIEEVFENARDLALVREYFDIRAEGNWEHGKNVLQVLADPDSIAAKYELTRGQLDNKIKNARSALLAHREKRIRPGLDDKILTSWNALMLKGLVDAHRALGDDKFLGRAKKNAAFIRREMLRTDGGLNRNYKDGKSSINAFLDDYAAVIQAWIALYQTTFDERWLEEAKALTDYVFDHFFDLRTGMFFYTSDEDPPLVTRRKEISDNVIPASNSMMARNLHRLGLLLYNEHYLNTARQMLVNVRPQFAESSTPSFHSNWLNAYMDYAWPLFETAVVGPDAVSLNMKFARMYLPQSLFLGGVKEGSLQLLQGKLQEGETYIYVCRDKVCKLPVQTIDEALELMK